MKKFLLVIKDKDLSALTENILNNNPDIGFVKKSAAQYDVVMKEDITKELMNKYEFMAFIKEEA